MKKHLLARCLMLVCGIFVCAFSARSALAPPNPGGQLPPNMQKSIAEHTFGFTSKNTLVFNKIAFGSGLVDNPAQFSGKKDPTWIAQHRKEQLDSVNASFLNARPLRLQVNYDGRSYAVANYAFQSSQSGATTVSCQGSPPAPVSAKGHPVVTPSPVAVGH